MLKFITRNNLETQTLGARLAKNLQGKRVICLSGELGSGKTTFVQGFLKELKIKGPYTSPTFVIMKQYQREIPNLKSQISNKIQNPIRQPADKIQNIFHLDAYRVGEKDILALGWEEIIQDHSPASENIVLVEWAERIKKIIPKEALRIKFKWLSDKEREITFE